MKIGEIISIQGGMDIQLSSFNRYFKLSDTTPLNNGFQFAEAGNDSDVSFLAILDEDKNVVSVIHLTKDELPLFQIKWSSTAPEHQRKGLFRYLINKAIELHGAILSDDAQSEGANMAWKGLMKNPGNLKIGIYNTETQKISPLPEDHTLIWNEKTNPVLIAYK